MTDRELALIARGMVPVIREAIDVVAAPLIARIAALEQRAMVPPARDGRDGVPGPAGATGPVGQMGEKGMAGDMGPVGPIGPAGERGEPGESGPAGDVGPIGPAGPVGEIGPAGPIGEKGADGRDGKDVDMEVVTASIATEVQKQFEARTAALVDEVTAKAVAVIPVPKDGSNGRDGADGRDGKDGDSVSVDDVSALVLTEVAKAMAAIPIPKDGQDGSNGKDGADGRDGFGFDDLDVTFDGEKSFTFRFERGDIVKEFPFRVPALVYRDVFASGQSYQAGDVVTWAGGMWVAKADTNEKPGAGATAWKLCVKAGRDGKEGKSGPQGPAGPRGEKAERW